MSQFSKGNTNARKLDAEQVLEIRRLYDYGKGYNQARLSRQFGVSINTIQRIVTGLTWQQVPMPPREISDAEIEAMARRSAAQFGVEYVSPAEAALNRMQGEIAKAKESGVEGQLDKLKGGSK